MKSDRSHGPGFDVPTASLINRDNIYQSESTVVSSYLATT